MKTISILLVTLPFVFAQCKLPSVPLDPAVVGKSLFANLGCSPGGSQSTQSMKIEPYGVFYSPLDASVFIGGSACREHIVALFRRSDKPALILHRPSKQPKDFAKTHPAVYQAFLKDQNTAFPCHTVPVERLFVWGPKRVLFRSLVSKAIKGIERIRGFDCGDIIGRPQPKSKAAVDFVLQRHRIANAAINYLHGLAYANFFCVG